MQILKHEQRYSGTKAAVWVVLAVDDISELPEDTSGYLTGSIAWAVDSGDIYGLSSSGAWVLQENIVLAL